MFLQLCHQLHNDFGDLTAGHDIAGAEVTVAVAAYDAHFFCFENVRSEPVVFIHVRELDIGWVGGVDAGGGHEDFHGFGAVDGIGGAERAVVVAINNVGGGGGLDIRRKPID